MKKLFAILLSMLMLCTMIPFATVSAAEGINIVLEVSAEEINAGDEFEVTAYLEGNPGLIGVQVIIRYDTDNLELVGEWDGEDFYPEVSFPRKWRTNYISYGPPGTCIVTYLNATASSEVTEEEYFTALFKAKDDAYTGNYDLTVEYNPANFFGLGLENVPVTGVQNGSIYVNGRDPEPACEHEYEYDCSKVCSKCGEETRPEAEHQYFYACDPVCMICYEMTNPEAAHTMNYVEAKDPTCTENGNIAYWTCDACGGCWDNENATGMPLNRMMTIVPAAHTYFDDCSAICEVCGEEREVSHNVIHVEAKDPTCTENGNIEYWYCDVCGSAWLDEACTLNTNLQAVKLAASCKYGAVHTAAKEATCFEEGNVEYWYCANCDVYYLDEACTIITNAKSVILPIAHNVIHVEAKDATCYEEGNIEYWYCDICGAAWTDELLREVTNLKNVILPIAHNVIHVEAKDATCFEEGNIEYWYCDICGAAWTDELLREVTNLKNVILPIAHNVIHVEAKDATCTELGNIEYWYCDICGSAWLDEYCHLNTNLMAVKLPMADHVYDDDLDEDCNVCGAIRVITYEVKTFGGNSIAESNDGLSGLAFKFNLTEKITGLKVVDGTLYVADYTDAYVTPDSTGTYKLVKMGAKVYNGKETQDVAVKKVILEGEGAPYYVIRIVNIPEAHYNTDITCTPYFVYKDANGKNVTVTLDSYTACAADFMD